MNRPAARQVVAVLLLYVLPLGVTAALLASVGLGRLALALLAVEATVATAVALARRPRATPVAARPRDGSTVLLVLGAGVLVVVGLLVALRISTA